MHLFVVMWTMTWACFKCCCVIRRNCCSPDVLGGNPAAQTLHRVICALPMVFRIDCKSKHKEQKRPT